jgi:cyclopropane-fatty-acyl-phospholipid synthase
MFRSRSSAPSQSIQLGAARESLQHLAEVLNLPISVRLWDGSRVPLGREVHPELCVAIHGPGVIGSLVRWPTVDNLVRHYASGQIEVQGGDLIDLAEAVRHSGSRAKLKQVQKGLLLKNALPFLFTPAPRLKGEPAFAGDEVGRGTSRRKERDYIQFHYDLSNDFYRLFLDREMQYSCGYFTEWNNPLDQAQQDKLEMICRKLRLAPGERLLDIGCGWGGLACYAAEHYGVQVLGVTLSQQQFDFAQQKVRDRGLQDRVTIELRDYSTLSGTFDKIASIGMYEHVGIANYPRYFGKIFSLLRDRGILLNHGITRPLKRERRFFKRMRPAERLLLKYIFPGGELDNIGHTCQVLETSKFEVHDVEDWREHYALTTRHWCKRLCANRDQAVALVGPERYRLWAAYLAGCSFGFLDGSLRIYQVVASKRASRGRAELPPTRADLYREAA